MSSTNHHAAHDRAGTEPRNARSPLKLRLILAIGATVVTVVAAILLVVAANAEGTNRSAVLIAAAICLGVAVIAVIDVFQVARRIRHGDQG